MPYNLSSNRSYVLNKGLPRRMLDLIESQGGLSATEARKLGKRGSCQVALCMLFKRGYVKRFEFATTEGMIYYKDKNAGWNYGLSRELIPASAQTLFDRIALNGAVSTLELRDLGVLAQDIEWFGYKLAKSGLVRMAKLDGYNVFYREEPDLAEYEKKHLPSLPAVQSRVNAESERRGQALEDMLVKYYGAMGFDIERNKFFKDAEGRAFEVDLLATQPELGLTIAVEAKNYCRYTLGPAVLLQIAKIRDVMPRALVHIYARNISYHLIHSPFFRQNPSVWLFNSKRINEIFERMNVLKAS